MVYESRPRICAAYEPGVCDYGEAEFDYDHLFTHAKQIERYYEEKTGRKLAKDYEPAPRRNGRGKKRAMPASNLVSLRTP